MNREAILADFDQEVKSRCELIHVNAENVSANLQSALELTLLAIPELVRKMPVKELMEKFDGDIQKAASYFANRKIPVASPRGVKKDQTPANNKKPIKRETPTSPKTSARPKTPKQIPVKSSSHLMNSGVPAGRSVTPTNTSRSAIKKKMTPNPIRQAKKPILNY